MPGLIRWEPNEDVIFGRVVAPAHRPPAEPPATSEPFSEYEAYFSGLWRPCEPPQPLRLGFWARAFFVVTGLKPHD